MKTQRIVGEPRATASQKEGARMVLAASRGEAVLWRRHVESHLLLLPNPLCAEGKERQPSTLGLNVPNSREEYHGLSAVQHPAQAARATEGRAAEEED